MDGLTAWMEKYILPVAGKIGAQKHLVALRDAFIGTMPATMAGSIAVMINAMIRDLPQQFFSDYAANLAADKGFFAVINVIIGINGFVWNGTLAIAGLIFAFSWGYNLARAYKVNDLAGGIVGLATLIQGIAFSYSNTLETAVPKELMNTINAGSADSGWSATAEGLTAGGWGWLKLDHLNGNAYFTVMIMGAISVIIFCKLMLANITIKMPDSVPPAVSKAFAAILPATIALYVIAIINYVVGKLTNGQLIIDLVQKYIAEPFLGLSQGLGAVLIVTIFVQIFWFFGIHGPNVLAPVLEGIWGQAQLINIDIFQKGYKGLTGTPAVLKAIDDGKAYMWVRGSFDAFAWFGGSGGTIVLIIAILLFSKRADYLTVGKLSLGPGIFNINEPIMFGLPIVLNAIMFVPFLVAPVVATSIGWLATYFGLVAPVSQQVTWVVPPILLSFLATGADWRAPIVTIVCMVVTFLIWTPFVIAANRMEPTDFE
ncbi:PTS sugar transporter subunit IIC [Enterococcus caccae]|uniref:Permease IIC component n=2 Tax=Enterococcus caccae TaxID=317735 RepID=R3X0F7_9ENTE|nr:PTS sugar transporter subunit IIC [Enterococcus caccae]EOL47480.1 PTS system, lactose/cellobiose family IIC component [Enterococcus caccae ATCC BAA-1240]EOT65687.1 PTS system, cellobiose-specific IIC component [Enterococcus caccae ATCC BAA-1240]OJG23159.1 PTS system, lactose/cellobiose family IIC component [Enterococcus caccae]